MKKRSYFVAKVESSIYFQSQNDFFYPQSRMLLAKFTKIFGNMLSSLGNGFRSTSQ